jgi:hypothetical protein
MVDTGIFCTTAEVQYKAGANASTTSNAETYINNFVTQAESRINAETHYNWSDKYSTLNVDVKGVLKEACSCLSATYVISYDMGGFNSRAEAQAMIDVLMYHYNACIKILKEQLVKDFIIGA